MQYTLNGEAGDRSSDGEDDNDGLSSNPLAHPFSNTLYNYGQHTSLPQPWQQASGLAISYPSHSIGNGSMGADSAQHKTSGGMYPDDDVLEREMALLEEEDPTLFLDGLMDTRAEDLDSLMPLESAGRASISTLNSRPQTSQPTPRIAVPSAPQPQPKAGPSRPPMTSSTSQTQHHHHGYQPASLSSITGAKDRSLDQLLISFWTHQMDLAEKGTAANGPGSGEGQENEEHDEFKTFGLPLARIKKVMKSDPDVKMISAEVPVLLSKACEIFIAELTCRAWLVAESHKRRTLQKSDVASAIGFSDMFDFLIDIVPREEAISKSELGMKRRTARMKEKKEEERKRKRQEELEEAYAYSQAQAQSQVSQAANHKLGMASASSSMTQVPLQGRPEGPALVRAADGSNGQSSRPLSNQQREVEMPPEKKRREE